MLLAHPLTDPGGLGVPPYVIALIAVVLVAAVAELAPVRAVDPRPRDEDQDDLDDVDRPLGRWRRTTRAIAVIVLLLLVYAGRRGSGDGLSNITPPLVVGVGWALLVVASLVICRLWSWVDPWDAAARAIEPLAGGPPAESSREPSAEPTADAPTAEAPRPDRETPSVWPAVAAAAAVVYYLVVRADSTQPRAIGAALAAYTIVAVAIGVALGRRSLARADVFGLTARWAGELRSRLAVGWAVPAGAHVVLGVVAGGLLLDVSRRAGAYADVLDRVTTPAGAATPRTLTISLAVVCAVAAAVLHGAERMGQRRGASGTVAPAVLPVVLGLVVVWRLRRLLVSLQLLPITASDPLGRGWDLLGTKARVVDPNPFGTAAQRWTGVVVVVLGGVVGAVVLRRRVAERAARQPASYALYLLVGLSVLALAVAA